MNDLSLGSSRRWIEGGSTHANETGHELFKRFLVEPGTRVKLHKVDPGYVDPNVTENDALKETKKLCKRLRKLQASLYSEKRRSLLIVLKALDTGGKDGVINHVLGTMNPLGCRVVSFKKPGPEAVGTNYLWRVSIVLPEKGEVVIFNRSHYEDVLVVKVHDLIAKDEVVSVTPLNSFEHFLMDNDTHVLKFFLHISRRRTAPALSSGGWTTRSGTGGFEPTTSKRKVWDATTEAYAGSPVPLQH